MLNNSFCAVAELEKGGLLGNKGGLLGDKAGLSKKGTHHFWMRPLFIDYDYSMLIHHLHLARPPNLDRHC